MTIHNDIEEIVFTKEELQDKVQQLGEELSREYKDKYPLVVCILKGGSMFMTDLIKEMDIYLDIDFMDLASYHGGTESTNDVKILKDLSQSVKDRHVLFVEDIIDTGRTLEFLIKLFKTRQAASVDIVTLLNKPSRRLVDVDVKWTGFDIPDSFAVGYGLDYQEKYRNLPYIGVLKDEAINLS
ncbi:MAG: hypoxanthine phosphoribosyltransferase [Atopococcus tabaci]|uniref:Hypoxanthine phosphoribosyltransferase n=1 Tax=Atopococcus tabaci TaxID=269774 RepID=A0AA43ZRT7_9LACT|nr:hypoxanthine phosphoribosyltransferase [Atopococcus tabaci]